MTLGGRSDDSAITARTSQCGDRASLRMCAIENCDCPDWVAKSRSPRRGGVVRPLVWPVVVEWPLLKVQRSVASQGHEWQVPAEAVVGPQNRTGRSQSAADVQNRRVGGSNRLAADIRIRRLNVGGCRNQSVTASWRDGPLYPRNLTFADRRAGRGQPPRHRSPQRLHSTAANGRSRPTAVTRLWAMPAAKPTLTSLLALKRPSQAFRVNCT